MKIIFSALLCASILYSNHLSFAAEKEPLTEGEKAQKSILSVELSIINRQIEDGERRLEDWRRTFPTYTPVGGYTVETALKYLDGIVNPSKLFRELNCPTRKPKDNELFRQLMGALLTIGGPNVYDRFLLIQYNLKRFRKMQADTMKTLATLER
jgi:hypothetical protein